MQEEKTAFAPSKLTVVPSGRKTVFRIDGGAEISMENMESAFQLTVTGPKRVGTVPAALVRCKSVGSMRISSSKEHVTPRILAAKS